MLAALLASRRIGSPSPSVTSNPNRLSSFRYYTFPGNVPQSVPDGTKLRLRLRSVPSSTHCSTSSGSGRGYATTAVVLHRLRSTTPLPTPKQNGRARCRRYSPTPLALVDALPFLFRASTNAPVQLLLRFHRLRYALAVPVQQAARSSTIGKASPSVIEADKSGATPPLIVVLASRLLAVARAPSPTASSPASLRRCRVGALRASPLLAPCAAALRHITIHYLYKNQY